MRNERSWSEWAGYTKIGRPMMNDCKADLTQPDEGDFLRNEVSDEALEAAASVLTAGLPTLWYSTHCFGCPSWPALRRRALFPKRAIEPAAHKRVCLKWY